MNFCQRLKFEAQKLWYTLYLVFLWPLTKIKVNRGGDVEHICGSECTLIYIYIYI